MVQYFLESKLLVRFQTSQRIEQTDALQSGGAVRCQTHISSMDQLHFRSLAGPIFSEARRDSDRPLKRTICANSTRDQYRAARAGQRNGFETRPSSLK